MHTPCQLCAKRPATTHLTELDASGGNRELHLCGHCIQSLGIPLQDGPPPIAELIEKGAEDVVAATSEVAGNEVAEVVEDETCPQCGLAFSEYTANNLFGCAHDYAAFSEQLEPLLKRYHGATRHVGRAPTRTPEPAPAAEAVATPLGTRRRLEAALKDAVTHEHYEEAARVRDQLRQLESEVALGSASDLRATAPGAGPGAGIAPLDDTGGAGGAGATR
jgi:protein arginine kinase activator